MDWLQVVVVVVSVFVAGLLSLIGWALLTIYNSIQDGHKAVVKELAELSAHVNITNGRIIVLETKQSVKGGDGG